MPNWISHRWGSQRRIGSMPLWMLSAVIVVGVLALFLAEVGSRYKSVIAETERSAVSFAEVLAEHTARTFEAVDRTLQVAAALREDVEEGSLSPQSANLALRTLQRNSPALVAIGWTNAVGDVVAHSYEGEPIRRNIAGLAHFIAQRDTSSSSFFIAPPFRSVASGRWISAVSIRINHADGSFAGVVTAPLDQSYFTRIYRSVNLGPNGAVTLVRSDGRILTREPFVESALERSFGNTSLFTKHLPRSEVGVIETLSPVDGVARILAYRKVPGLPLIMLVTYDRATALRPWYNHVRDTGPLVAVLIAVILLGTWLLSRRTNELAKQKSLLEATLDNIDQGLVTVEADGIVSICNRRALELLDLPAEFIAARPRTEEVLDFLLARGEFAGTADSVHKLLKPNIREEFSYVYERMRPNGTILEVRTMPLSNGGSVRTFKDITARRRDELELKDREARYRLLADNSTDMIFRLDLNFVRQYVSPACHEILGYQPEELLGRNPVNMIHPDDADRVGMTYRAVANGIARTSVTNRIRHRDGRWIWVEAELRLVRDPETGLPAGILGALRDVSIRKAIEAEAAAARHQAERAAAAQSEFLATMSHELRTPLNGILGFADIILGRDDLVPEVRRQISLIQTASDSLLTVVNDILDFSQIEEGRLELALAEFHLSDLIDDSVAIVHGFAAAKNLDLRVSAYDRVPTLLRGDDRRLRQVLLNLLNNAIKFTHTGHITLGVEREMSDARSERLRFTVTDTGIGIPDDKIERLFLRFSQVDGSTSREFGGSGLGLAISKRLVELMGGQIGVESTHGRGSTFWFTVTLPTAESRQIAPPTALARSGAAASRRILIVEDVAINREIACSMVEAAGYLVDAVTDGADAIAALQRNDYDVVLMDIQMPGMDGVTATKVVRALPGPAGRIPIIAMTANVLPGQIEVFRAAGMNEHVGKPFRREDLIAAIESCFAGARFSDPPLAWPTLPVTFEKHLVLDKVKLNDLQARIGQQKVASLLRLFAIEVKKIFIVEPDHPDIRKLIAEEAHSFAGSAGMFGFDDLMEACRALKAEAVDGTTFQTSLDRARRARDSALDEMGRLTEDLLADPLRTTA